MAQPSSEDSRETGRRVVGRVLGIAIVVATAIVGAIVYRRIFDFPRTDDAYVRANVIGIAPHVSGPIVELPIVDNQSIHAGDLLFAIDARPYQAELARAEATLNLTELEIRGYESAVGAAEARLAQRTADTAYARQFLGRIEPLEKGQFVTQNQVFEARTKLHAAEAAEAEARSEVERARQLQGQLGDVNTRRQAAIAARDNARLNVDYCRVYAPFDALVTNLNIAVGQYANEGREIFALVDDRVWYVLANFRESFLRHIAPGMPADVFLVGYPGHLFRGRVQGIGWALHQNNGATVGVLPAVEPTLNWVRLAQRFPVRIVLDDRDPAIPFRMGATAVVTVRSRE